VTFMPPLPLRTWYDQRPRPNGSVPYWNIKNICDLSCHAPFVASFLLLTILETLV